MQAPADLIRAYYAAFNDRDLGSFLSLLAEDVIHDLNQGCREIGKGAFRRFLEHMNRCYREEISELEVLTNPEGSRAAAEFMVDGTYLETDEGLPVARGQRYRLAAGAFFEIRGGKISRVTNYYNLPAWIAQVTPGS